MVVVVVYVVYCCEGGECTGPAQEGRGRGYSFAGGYSMDQYIFLSILIAKNLICTGLHSQIHLLVHFTLLVSDWKTYYWSILSWSLIG